MPPSNTATRDDNVETLSLVATFKSPLSFNKRLVFKFLIIVSSKVVEFANAALTVFSSTVGISSLPAKTLSNLSVKLSTDTSLAVANFKLSDASTISRFFNSSKIKPLTLDSSGPILPDNFALAVSLSAMLVAIDTGSIWAVVATFNVFAPSTICNLCNSPVIKPLTLDSSGPILPDNTCFADSLSAMLAAIAAGAISSLVANFEKATESVDKNFLLFNASFVTKPRSFNAVVVT